MPHHGQLSSDAEIKGAGLEGLKGAIHGAAVWGIPTLIASVAAHKYYPLYRNLTFQFKVYIQMSGMTVGSVIEADQRFRAYEKHTRRMRRVKRDQEAWKRYQDDYQEDLKRSQKTTD